MLRGIADGRRDSVRLRHFAGLADDDNKAPAPLATHMWHDAFGQFPCAYHLGLQVSQQSTCLDFLKTAGQMRPGVADDDVDSTEGGGHVVNECFDLNRITNIGDETTRTINLRYRTVKLGLLPSGKSEFAALVGKALGNGKADSARTTGHQRDFVFQTKVHEFAFSQRRTGG